ncbi:GNAT family N-acetyltransferase [Acidaminobacter sp. JC074]|uniref:GNAT family N-acetyltransferase n=1 Tax=Acidaminobacter sp. JC074 TaxID=2530199 RepID=UPI001F0D715F|nr:GNAT family protein [Acidaminobacter sp. JC074]MCH4890250.1 GNAT family N-acetyltransferase [Acidaminobacter sp. JC074]
MYTGEKIRLRAYTTGDIEQAQAYVNDPEVKHYLTPTVPFPLTYSDEKKFIEGMSAFKDAYSFAIDTLEGKYIGGCGLNKVDWKNRTCVVGIFIGDKSYWGKGYGTDAMKVLINFIFDEMNLNRIELNVYSFNERAIKSYEKCGFVKEGVLRQALYKAGAYHDEVIMSILKDEYVL